jgi:type IV secretory pathway VirB6-like protein
MMTGIGIYLILRYSKSRSDLPITFIFKNKFTGVIQDLINAAGFLLIKFYRLFSLKLKVKKGGAL